MALCRAGKKERGKRHRRRRQGWRQRKYMRFAEERSQGYWKAGMPARRRWTVIRERSTKDLRRWRKPEPIWGIAAGKHPSNGRNALGGWEIQAAVWWPMWTAVMIIPFEDMPLAAYLSCRTIRSMWTTAAGITRTPPVCAMCQERCWEPCLP